MTRLSDAWAALATTPAGMLHIGDSVTEGTGSGGFEAKWTTKLVRGLQSASGIPGGPGFVNTGSFTPTDNSLSSFYSPVPSTGSSGFLGNRSGSLATNQALTITFTGTSIQLHFFENYGGALAMTVSIDGGGGISVPISSTGSPDNRGVWHSSTLTAGTHTAVVTPGTGQALILRGIHIFNGDEGKGIHGWEGGHYGDPSGTQSSAAATYFQDGCAVIQPAVVTLFLGLNDYQAGTAAATYQANLAAIVAAVNSYCTIPPSWVICGPYLRTDVTSPAVPLSAYTAAAKAVADADTLNRRFVDLNTAGVTLGADQVHPTPAGHAAIASAVQPAVSDLANLTPPPVRYVVRNIT